MASSSNSSSSGSQRPSTGNSPRPMAPGDEAPSGAPGTGERVCPRCGGSGKTASGVCPECQGSGKVIGGIGGA